MRERPLGPSERDELAGLLEQGLELLGGLPAIGDFFPQDCDDPAEVVGCIRRFVDAFRERGKPDDAERVAFALGVLWGDELQKTLGWSWIVLDDEAGVELFGIASPDRACAIRPQLFLYRLLSQRESDNAILLLFNMLKAGQLPPGAAGSYTEVS